jgi:hypothetical protein
MKVTISPNQDLLTVDDKKYKVQRVGTSSCGGCAFETPDRCSLLTNRDNEHYTWCTSYERRDRKSIIWKEMP